MVVAGELEIDLTDGTSGTSLRLRSWNMVTIPAGVIHRTRAHGRTVNITVEHLGADTTFVDAPDAAATGGPSSAG